MAALAIATLLNGPLAYDGAYFLFGVLDSGRTMVPRHRLIHVPIQESVLVATRFTNDLRVLCLIFCAEVASIPAIGLAVSWLVCRRRPSLFIWPAMAICVMTLPGQFFFISEQLMVVTLMWPALLTGLIGAQSAILSLVAILTVIATFSHPNTAVLLLVVLLTTLLTSIKRPELRRESLRFAALIAMLLVVRLALPLDEWERSALSWRVVTNSFYNAVYGWPIVATGLTAIAAVGCLVPIKRAPRSYLLVPLVLAGLALVAWTLKSENWSPCLDYRYWVAPFSTVLMLAAAADELWIRSPAEGERQSRRVYAFPVIGAIFFTVLSTQTLQWANLSQKLRQDLLGSKAGCLTGQSLMWVQATPLDHWSIAFYAIELQGWNPATIVLAEPKACESFMFGGNAIMVEQGTFVYTRKPDEGRFDFNNAMWRQRLQQDFLAPASAR